MFVRSGAAWVVYLRADDSLPRMAFESKFRHKIDGSGIHGPQGCWLRNLRRSFVILIVILPISCDVHHVHMLPRLDLNFQPKLLRVLLPHMSLTVTPNVRPFQLTPDQIALSAERKA